MYPILEISFGANDSWEPCECSLAHSSALQLNAHYLERTSDTRNAARGMLQPPACATAHHTRTPSCLFAVNKSAGRVRLAPACTPFVMLSEPDPPNPPRPVPALSLARMQLLQPLLRCPKLMQIILVTGRKHVDARAQTKSLARGRW